MSVWYQINRKMVNNIWFRFDLIRFRKYFSVCTKIWYCSGHKAIGIMRVQLRAPWNLSRQYCTEGPPYCPPLSRESEASLAVDLKNSSHVMNVQRNGFLLLCQIKPDSTCNYVFPIDLASNWKLCGVIFFLQLKHTYPLHNLIDINVGSTLSTPFIPQ